jgi:hypothetical protein
MNWPLKVPCKEELGRGGVYCFEQPAAKASNNSNPQSNFSFISIFFLSITLFCLKRYSYPIILSSFYFFAKHHCLSVVCTEAAHRFYLRVL